MATQSLAGVHPPLLIEKTEMKLDTRIFRDDNTPDSPPPGAYGERSAQGGVPPYHYSSSGDAAEVESQTGVVISRKNGGATITVTDSVLQSVSYEVRTSNVFRLFGTGLFSTYGHCAREAENMGGKIPALLDWQAYRSIYNNNPNLERWCWASDAGNAANMRKVIFPATGEIDERLDIGIGGGTADGFGIRGD